jgi:hypothetical protein
MMEQEQFDELSRRLDKLATLLALSIIRDMKPEDQIMTLAGAGYQPSQIASLIHKTPNAVRIMLHQLRKKSKPGKAA